MRISEWVVGSCRTENSYQVKYFQFLRVSFHESNLIRVKICFMRVLQWVVGSCRREKSYEVKLSQFMRVSFQESNLLCRRNIFRGFYKGLVPVGQSILIKLSIFSF